MALYLVAGTPGQSKGAAAEKIAVFFREHNIGVGAAASVEEELLELFPDYKVAETSLQEPRVALIGERAQDEIKEKWTEAYKNAVAKATSGNPDVAIVLLCFEYYRYETYEFYSPVDINAIRESKPTSALTLIDDIFDIYYRLSRPGQVFDIQTLIERTFPASASRCRDPLDLRRLYKDALGVTIGSMLRILAWREKEVECAANVSRAISCEHAVLAMKHPVETGARLLLGSTTADFDELGVSYPVYVSHPISRPRRDRSSKGDWPPFVNDLEEVVAGLARKRVGNCQIVPVMPTAIDEFRILDDGTYFHPCLTPRWKLMNGNLLFSLPKPLAGAGCFASYDDYELRGLPRIFDPPLDSTGRRVGFPLSDSEVSGMLRNLRESVRLQMAGRDHLLVRQCPGFFLYRPLYGDHEFSGGVASEIHTYDQIRKYTSSLPKSRKRHVAFVHDASDAAGLFAKNKEGYFPDPVHQTSAALSRMASQLVDRSGVKTRRPRSPEDETVANALQSLGDPQKKVRAIYDQMFPPQQAGSIGSEQPLPWEATEQELKKTIEQEKVRALSGDIGHIVLYRYCQDTLEYECNPENGKPDTYVEVVENLDSNGTRRNWATARTQEFFADATT